MNIVNLPKYHGEATFSGGTVAIQQLRCRCGRT